MRPHPIPLDWSAEQALRVLQWLQGLVDILWDTYEDELVEALAERAPADPPDQLDLPF